MPNTLPLPTVDLSTLPHVDAPVPCEARRGEWQCADPAAERLVSTCGQGDRFTRVYCTPHADVWVTQFRVGLVCADDHTSVTLVSRTSL